MKQCPIFDDGDCKITSFSVAPQSGPQGKRERDRQTDRQTDTLSIGTRKIPILFTTFQVCNDYHVFANHIMRKQNGLCYSTGSDQYAYLRSAIRIFVIQCLDSNFQLPLILVLMLHVDLINAVYLYQVTMTLHFYHG